MLDAKSPFVYLATAAIMLLAIGIAVYATAWRFDRNHRR